MRRALTPVAIAVAIALPSLAPGAPASSPLKYPQVRVPASAASGSMRTQIHQVNGWWVRNHDYVPCAGCIVRPPQSDLLWTFYRGQGLYPNWVRAGREVLRRKIRGDGAGLVTGGREILEATTVKRLPNGLRFRVIESAYTAPDGQRPPWRDAMGNGIAMSILIPSLPADAFPGASAFALPIANEYLNTFAVHWTAGGIMERGQGRGRWYLEYAYRQGADSRVLNGFMQSLVSLDRFSRQAESLARYDRGWLDVRDRARDYVDRGVIELVRYLPLYDLGGGVSKYSLTRPGPAPAKYHEYHLQLLARLEQMSYLPAPSLAVITSYRERWGGKPLATSLERDPGPTIPAG